ncbi:nucleotidyltransferase family protein [Gluconacetobacter entanii]|jgi:MurNAc alpha-1-phosphate uridylyltransferase|uniref:Mannose-1-phosphate guanylyltransferase n=1 Tax=Gluconacetobacter entanii TaxID=108528 RepID=A0A318PXQ7_9PROT|nr:nucleotidyltransferase family protein [Gluconacetobacter entanii]MBE7618340.1 NTP transferase domain-containing protein [Komagataeibacter sp. FXV2]MCE2578573.1 nucleotidyltransferase family protein [Komagataeibacter sp. FNDCR1]MBY4639432.1 nucleotidyltransferase family protein [Gluconacetobacter entanii]MCW4581471.1 nucleotidyltransferase family protein [Gluconacetobacter entanii]MCW4584850.1 nucleotidyltransferase family protein [Gluconacetobacter entanii]
MSVDMPETAMIFAAGMGRRMRPLSETTPKPLLKVGGQAILCHALDRLDRAGVGRVVVNAHWHADMVAAALEARRAAGDGPRTVLRREDELLETGGSAAAALRAGQIGPGPFFLLNGDAMWLNGPQAALRRLAAAFDPAKMDAMLLLGAMTRAVGEVGRGDFAVDAQGRPRRPKGGELTPYVYTGVQIVSPALFEDAPDGAFSLNLLWDRAMARGRLGMIVHDSLWFHLSRPQDIAAAEATLRSTLDPDHDDSGVHG